MRTLSKCLYVNAFAAALCLFAAAPAEYLFAQAKSTPPILEVETKPGGVRVFVDGIPVGRTSRDGHLRLTRVGRGLHTVRLTYEGYRDYTHDLQLEAGQVVPFIVELEKLRPGERAGELTDSRKTSSESSYRETAEPGGAFAEQGVLRGLVVRELTPATRQKLRMSPRAQGVVISEVKADSPCGAARLQKNDVIEQINHRLVHSTQEFMRLASNAGGQVVVRIHRRGKTQLVVVSESQ